MKVEFIDNKIILYIINVKDLDLDDTKSIEKYLKKIIISLKKRYFLDLNGFYNAKIYENKKYGLVVELINKEKFDFIKDLIDLKITINKDSDIYLKFDDYFLIKEIKNIYYSCEKYYLNIENINIIDFCEHMEIVYGDKLDKIKKEAILLK